MPIDLLSTIKKTSQFAFSSPLLNNLLGSSLFCSLFITIIIMLLIMFIYPAKEGTPMSILCKLFIYSFCGTLIIVFLHDGIIKHMFDEKEQKKLDIDIMQGTNINNRDIVYSSKIITPGIVGSYENNKVGIQGTIREDRPTQDIERPAPAQDRLNNIEPAQPEEERPNNIATTQNPMFFSIENELVAPSRSQTFGGNSFAL
jgi:hypothetical protein